MAKRIDRNLQSTRSSAFRRVRSDRDTTASAWVSESAVQDICGAADRAHPLETGGVLAGVAGPNGRRWITHAVEIPGATASSNHYSLPSGSRQGAIDKLREVDSRLGYVGDWHSHPAHVGPSSTDINAICGVADEDGTILVVAMRSTAGYLLTALTVVDRKTHRLALIAAGSLPPLRSGKRP